MMNNGFSPDVDFIEELKLRRWARENYVSADRRDTAWHPIVLEEMTRKDSEVIVEAIFDSIVRSLKTDDKIEIRGFGSFRTRQRQARIGRNPKTGTRVEVPAKRIPYFKPSKELKDLVGKYGR